MDTVNTALLVFTIAVVSIFAIVFGNRLDTIDNNQFYQARATHALFICENNGFKSDACEAQIEQLPKQFKVGNPAPPHP